MNVKELIADLTSKDQVARIQAAARLAELGAEASPAVPVLVDMLKSDNETDQKLAAWTLGEIGPLSQGAVPFLFGLAQEDDDVGDVAMDALEKLDLVEDEAA